jgi:uncharacterized protein YkwD
MFITKPPRIFSHISVLTLALTFLVGTPAVGYAQAQTEEKVSPFTQIDIVREVNEARTKEGLSPLTIDSKLTLAAQEKAIHMAQNKYFGHWSPDGSTPWDFMDNAEYDYQYAGENLAMYFFDTEDMVRAWLKSPTHRENIMNKKFEETGIGIIYGEKSGKKGWMVVQMFGTEY